MARKKLIDQTTQYAQDAIDGKRPVGKFELLACERHLRDLKDGHERGLTWHPDIAEEEIGFYPDVLQVTEGEKEGEPFTLLPWHMFTVGSLFGWKDKNGLRRFRQAWLETGKGQAKSPLMAAIGIKLLSFSGIQRADIYCIGEDKETAKVVFKDAVAMTRAPIPGMGGETLESNGRLKIRGTGDLAYKIEHLASRSSMQPIANTDSRSGPKPTAVFGDEIHEMKTKAAIETWTDAIGKMSGDPLMILGTNTPGMDQTVGTDYSEYYQKVLTGEYTDDSAFAFIARTDPDDDPFEDESCWYKSLPALGITFPIENVRKMVDRARYDISRRLGVERLYFGIPVGSSGFWMEEQAWDACRGDVDEKANKGRNLHLSLDLSQKNDLTALSGAWEPDDKHKLEIKTWYWTCENNIVKRTAQDRIPYRELEEADEITIVKARTIDYKFVAVQVQQLVATQTVVQMVCDAAFIADFMDACDEISFPVWLYEGPDEPEGQGLKIVRHKQGAQIAFPRGEKETDKPKKSTDKEAKKVEPNWLDMPHSVASLIDDILEEKIVIDNGRLTTICSANAILESDAQDNKYFHKKKSRGRIDGIVTIAMAVGSTKRMMGATPKPTYKMMVF